MAEEIYAVVVNGEEQYSIWPAERDTPIGWRHWTAEEAYLKAIGEGLSRPPTTLDFSWARSASSGAESGVAIRRFVPMHGFEGAVACRASTGPAAAERLLATEADGR